MGHWLPLVPNAVGPPAPSPTTVVDEIVDPAGRGKRVFMEQRGVYGGTFFVYGLAGPPRGHAVFDPVHRIVYYDEGCCSWHHVSLTSKASPPPKTIATRSLTGLRTTHGIRLGDTVRFIRSIYGPATLRAVVGAPLRTTLSYTRAIIHPAPYSPCVANTTFLFERERLIGMDLYNGC